MSMMDNKRAKNVVSLHPETENGIGGKMINSEMCQGVNTDLRERDAPGFRVGDGVAYQEFAGGGSGQDEFVSQDAAVGIIVLPAGRFGQEFDLNTLGGRNGIGFAERNGCRVGRIVAHGNLIEGGDARLVGKVASLRVFLHALAADGNLRLLAHIQKRPRTN